MLSDKFHKIAHLEKIRQKILKDIIKKDLSPKFLIYFI